MCYDLSLSDLFFFSILQCFYAYEVMVLFWISPSFTLLAFTQITQWGFGSLYSSLCPGLAGAPLDDVGKTGFA